MSPYFSAHDLTLPLVDDALLDIPTSEKLSLQGAARHPPRILLLYGSLRERSYSRLLTEEAARIRIRLVQSGTPRNLDGGIQESNRLAAA